MESRFDGPMHNATVSNSRASGFGIEKVTRYISTWADFSAHGKENKEVFDIMLEKTNCKVQVKAQLISL